MNYTQAPRWPRSVFAGIGLFCFALLAYAWMLQYGPEKQQPCPLCVLQRYVYIVVGVLAFAAATHVKRGYPRAVWGIATMVAADIGAALALWQVLKGADMTSCREDPIGIFVNNLPTANLFPEYFFATGGCADQYFVAGIPVPVLSLIAFFGIAAASVLTIVKVWRTQNEY